MPDLKTSLIMFGYLFALAVVWGVIFDIGFKIIQYLYNTIKNQQK